LSGHAGASGFGCAVFQQAQAFGKPIREFQAVNFMVADSITQLDAPEGLPYGSGPSMRIIPRLAGLSAKPKSSRLKLLGPS
jgi:alkylation response protein AidB-like acyl-CoA dehydrogenase